MESIHQRIRRLREAAGIKPKDLARRMGVSIQTVQQWEGTGKRPTQPKIERLDRLAALLRVTVHELLTGDAQLVAAENRVPYDDPVTDRLIRAWTWLLHDEKQALLVDIEAKAAANKAIARELGVRFKVAPDHVVANHLPPAPKKAPRKG